MFMDLLRRRRSIRHFEDQPVESEKIEALIEAALRSPSSRGINPWEFVVVTDRRMLAALAGAKPHGSSFLGGAPLGLVVCADTRKSDVWVEDASIATLILHLAAESLGLGSCWIQVRERAHSKGRSAQDHVAGLLKLPAGVMVEAMLAIGYPAESKPPHPADALNWPQVHRETFGRPYR